MKLRTRIIWINCIIFLMASLITELIIYFIIADNKKENAYLKAYHEYEELNSYLAEKYNGNISEDIDNTGIYLQYLLKHRGNDYDICFRKDYYYVSDDGVETPESAGRTLKEKIVYTELYNNTILTINQLHHYSYRRIEHSQQDCYAKETIKGSKFIIFNSYLYKNSEYFELFHLTDITYVEEELFHLMMTMILVTILVVILSIILLNFILKKEFMPLQNLSNSAKLIAEGEYGERVPIVRQDEIGILSENFNKMALEVEKRTEYLIEEEKKKSLFMGNLTHELKTPMTAISGYAQTLLAANLSEEDEKESLLYIDKECKRLERLSQKMLQLLAIDSDVAKAFKMREIPVGILLDDVKIICNAILKNKDMELVIEENGESFFTDMDLMTDVLVNLVDNAIKASEPGQKIILRVKEGTIQVEDFGKGIPKEELQHILEPFYMIDKSRSRKNGGAGLGLALTALILEKLEVKLEIESEVGKGSCFILQFV